MALGVAGSNPVIHPTLHQSFASRNTVQGASAKFREPTERDEAGREQVATKKGSEKRHEARLDTHARRAVHRMFDRLA